MSSTGTEMGMEPEMTFWNGWIHRTNMKYAATKNSRGWQLVAFAVAVVTIATGCSVSVEAQCSDDEDCEGDERCVRGGGLLVRDGVCVDPDQREPSDAGGDVASDTYIVDDTGRDADTDSDSDADTDTDTDTDADTRECGLDCDDAQICTDSGCQEPSICDSDASPFGGGMGTTDEPYTICAAHHLLNMADGTVLGDHFELAADIDLDGEDMEVIASHSGEFGQWEAPFEGVFDGNGFEIRNLILDEDSDAVGLFGVVDGGVVRDVELVAAEVTGRDFVGALVGINAGDIEGVVAEVDVSGESQVGGLVGSSSVQSTVESVTVEGVVQGDEEVGGVTGRNEGVVVGASSSANVTGVSRVGGLAGDNYGQIQCGIENSQASGQVVGMGQDDQGWMPGSESEAGPDPTGMVGGLVGRNYVGCSVENSWASGDVDGGESAAVGGLVGWARPMSTIENSQASGDVAGGDFTGGLVGRLASVLGEDWGEDGPSLVSSEAQGDVSGINSVGGLVGRAEGTIQESHAVGEVRGAGMVGGLVGHVRETGFGTAGEIEDGVAGGDEEVVGEEEVGGLVGRNEGTIVRSRADRDVGASGLRAGGLVGYHLGEMSESFARGDVHSEFNAVGGLVGRMSQPAQIHDCYATGDVDGEQFVGGLVGVVVASIFDSVEIERTYSTGEVSSRSDQDMGGLVGENQGGVEDSYWNVDTSGLDESDGGTGLTSEEFGQQESFEGFDFGNIWEMGNERPVLQWE